MSSVILSIIVVGGAGILIGLVLGVAGKKLEVKVDEREAQVREALPGNNCGGCGFPGCDGCAAAIAAGTAPVNACPVGGAAVAKKIGAIMGEAVEESGPMVAFVKCAGTCDKTRVDYTYTGIEDCTIMPFVPNGGPKRCNWGCMGYGSCVKACSFDAIHIVNGIAKVDPDACKACGACTKVCPKHLIELVPAVEKDFRVQCSSQDKGKDVMSACDVGCIGCMKCAKNCPVDAITVVNNIAHIDYDKCQNCGLCERVCPKHCIHDFENKK